MESVARRAGVSRATLYLHWRGKQELFRGLVQQLHEEHLAAMQAAMQEPGLSLAERTLAMLEGALCALRGDDGRLPIRR